MLLRSYEIIVRSKSEEQPRRLFFDAEDNILAIAGAERVLRGVARPYRAYLFASVDELPIATIVKGTRR